MVKRIFGRRSLWLSAMAATCAVLVWSASPAAAIIQIPGEEITSRPSGAAKDSSHVIAVNVPSHTSQYLSTQAQINAVKAKGGLVILPHPSGSSQAPGYTYTQLKNLTNYDGVELTTLYDAGARYYGYDYQGSNSPLYYQYINRGAHFWGFRDGDIHALSETQGLRSSNVVFAPALTRDGVVQALRQGNFYTTRVKYPDSGALLRSFPTPTVDVTGKISVTAAPGYSIRYYSAVSDSSLTGTCTSQLDDGSAWVRVKDVCASDSHNASFEYQPNGTEFYVKIVMVKYADTYRWPSAMYQPIFISGTGAVAYNPYAATDPASTNKYVGSIHIHTRRSPDAPKGASPAGTLSFFAGKGFDWIVVTDHNRVTTDFSRPLPYALRNARVRRGGKVRLYFVVNDNARNKVTITIKRGRRVVKRLDAGWKRPNRPTYAAFAANIPAGTYSYTVYARDSSYNTGRSGAGKLVVRK